ncbi:MAG: class I SAM-dependent rRNA methyltransferase [Candidatus Kapaibacterium sp.]|jgi:23S rRNA (cytosine1962-C5)-methyltransferase
MTTLRLAPKAHKRIRQGHLWVFRDELAPHEPCEAGDLVRIVTDYDYDLGVGFYHPTSQIAVRLLAAPDFTKERITNRLRSALQLREQLFAPETAYRLVFGESDGFPGLIVDRYGDYCAVQFLSAGIDKRRAEITEALQDVMPNVKGIIAKNDSQLRSKEGLPRTTEVLFGEIPPSIEMTENGIRYNLSLAEGQKTGYFLDQRVNRSFIAQIAKGLRVMDCFTNQGGFALNAAAGGALEVLGVDSSASAIEACSRNAALNNYTKCSWLVADVFDDLKRRAAAAEKWDMIILDPPAFTKTKAQVAQAKRGYAEINRQALKLISNGGYLVSASCSHHMREDMLMDVILEESRRVNRKLALVYRGHQSPCHPVYMPMPETQYLKFLVFRVDGW